MADDKLILYLCLLQNVMVPICSLVYLCSLNFHGRFILGFVLIQLVDLRSLETLRPLIVPSPRPGHYSPGPSGSVDPSRCLTLVSPTLRLGFHCIMNLPPHISNLHSSNTTKYTHSVIKQSLLQPQ